MIQLLTTADAEKIAALDKAVFPDCWNVVSWQRELRNGLVLGCFQGEQLVGAASFQIVLDEAELYKIMVHKNVRQQGLGRELLAFGMENLRSRGVKRLFLEVAEKNQPARQLYQAFGFSRCGFRDNYYENPPDNAILMELGL